MNAIRFSMAAACMTVLTACSTVMPPAHSGFLSSYAALSSGPDGSAVMRSTTAIDPTRVTLGDIDWRAPVNDRISDAERRLLLRQLGDELMARVHDLPASPEGRPVILRA